MPPTAQASRTRRRRLQSVAEPVAEPTAKPTTPAGTVEGVSWADPAEVRAWAEELPDNYLHCRELNHTWKPFAVGRHRNGGYERTLRCYRCKTRKIQHLSVEGLLIGSPHYEYPDGYQHSGFGRIDGAGRGVLRITSIVRMAGDMDVEA